MNRHAAKRSVPTSNTFASANTKLPPAIAVSNAPSLHLGDLTLHPDENAVRRSGKTIQLCKKEYQLLEFLARHKNKVMNRNTLLEYVWNYNVQSLTNTLEVHMSKLRRKIDADYSNKIIQTVYGLGYKLCDNAGNDEQKTKKILLT